MSKVAVLPLIAGLAIGLAACDKGSGAGALPPGAVGAGQAQPDIKTVEPCSILTLDRAKQLIGDDAQPNESSPTGCSYNADSMGHSVTVKYEFDPEGTSFELGRKPGGKWEKVTGIGDDAYTHPDLSSLTARKGGVNFDVQIVRDFQDAAATTEMLKQLTKDLIAKNST